ncbi:PREDICTED: uncharacterized protein LOC106339116 [Brassica oleracea var. oleracea]|uniref:uncharacterized protein LOC106339116 n=1 Tax=Brassica oleracea var. oleracea TaxID=109376 RepID=UPI0006A70EA5|nr:PREDICTED: uncharacterized protein LOC106339116 [Brassica oleracea var. oleracea]
MASPITIICFDYGGSYIKDGGERRWISGEDEIHTQVMKTAVEEITYSELVESICRKIKANGVGMVKLSYFPMVLYSNNPSYIWCDEDVLGYLMQVNHDKCRSVLHVEISSDMDDTYGGMSLSGDDDETDDSYVGLSDGTEEDDTEQDGTDQDHEMDGVVALYTPEQHEDIEMHENLEHGYEGTEVRVEEEAGRAEVEAARSGVEAARAGDEAARAVVEATTAVEEEWDDGLDLVTGQEFRTKVAMQVLIQRGAHKNVDGEKDESWMWFMNKLRSVTSDEGELVFLSDRNARLIKSIREVFPMAAHGYCIWHLSQNVKRHVFNNRDACANKFTECAHAYTVAEFDDLNDAFSRRYPSAAAYLEKSVEVRKWARSEIPVTKKLVPTVEEELSKRCLEARCLDVVEINSFHLEYNVNGSDRKIYKVDLARKMCTCRCFDMDKIPCVHAAAAAKFLSVGRDLHLQEFCSKYYLVELWALAYCRTIYHVPHMSEWVIPDEIRALKVLPPIYEKKKGPTQKQRFPSAGESRGRRRGRRRGRGMGRGRRGGRLYEYFECGSTSATTE